MASIRLTNEIRESITKAMLKHRFSKELEKLLRMRAKLADRVYRDLYTASERKQMEALPGGWLPSSEGIKFQASGCYQHIPFNGGFYGELNSAITSKPERVPRLFAAEHNGSCVKVYDGAHPISAAHMEAEASFKDLSDRYSTAKRQIEAALAKASTTKRLIELWPEAAPFCAPFEKDAPSLPSVPVSTLNALLDLPVAA